MMLRIGILECDHLETDLVDIQGEYSDMFSDLLYSQVNNLEKDLDIEIAVYDLTTDHFPITLDACDSYLITGSRHGVYDVDTVPWLQKAKDLVVKLYDAKIPTIGICFGHQLIADALGGTVEKANDKGWGVGAHSWDIKNSKAWMGDTLLSELSLLAIHQDQVTKLPPNSTLIAGNEFCPIAGFQTGENILAFQGHPEFSNAYLTALMDKLQTEIGDKTLSVARKSLQKHVDDDLVGLWILNFLSQNLQ